MVSMFYMKITLSILNNECFKIKDFLCNRKNDTQRPKLWCIVFKVNKIKYQMLEKLIWRYRLTMKIFKKPPLSGKIIWSDLSDFKQAWQRYYNSENFFCKSNSVGRRKFFKISYSYIWRFHKIQSFSALVP